MNTTSVTLREALETYRKRVSILKKSFATEKYRIDQIIRSSLGEKMVREITSVDIATWRDERLSQVNSRTGTTIGPATVRLEMSLLSNMFDIGRIEWGICNDNPVTKVRKPKIPPGRDRRLTPREERLILRRAHQHPNKELWSIIIVALETAMRQGEILGIRWEHLNLSARIVHLPDTKNGSKRDVPLSMKARDAITRLGVKTQGKVFGYTGHGLKSTWRFTIRKLAIQDLHFHDLRHEAISRLFELGTMDIMEVSAISGHKSLAMLKRYTHLKAQRLVSKLEGNRHKGRRAVLDSMIPYPAALECGDDSDIRIRLLDFENLHGSGSCQDSAIRVTQDALLRRLLVMMRAGRSIPLPDQYLEVIDEQRLVMIDPLGGDTEAAVED